MFLAKLPKLPPGVEFTYSECGTIYCLDICIFMIFNASFAMGQFWMTTLDYFFVPFVDRLQSLWTTRGPNPFWSSMRANSISFSRNMCSCLWNQWIWGYFLWKSSRKKIILNQLCAHCKTFFCLWKKMVGKSNVAVKID